MNGVMLNAREYREVGGLSISVWLSSEAISSMVEASGKARWFETGGILIGRYSPDGRSAEIAIATPKPRGSGFGRFWFQRSNFGLEELLAHWWAKGFHYVGEWHSHPKSSPSPSAQDIYAMRKVAGDTAYNCKEPILVIIGGQPKKQWSMSVTVFKESQIITLEAIHDDTN